MQSFDEIIRCCCETVEDLEKCVMVVIVGYKEGTEIAEVLAPLGIPSELPDDITDIIIEHISVESAQRGIPIGIVLIRANSEALTIMSGDGVVAEKVRIPRRGGQLVLDDTKKGFADSDDLIHSFWRGIREATQMINPSRNNPESN